MQGFDAFRKLQARHDRDRSIVNQAGHVVSGAHSVVKVPESNNESTADKQASNASERQIQHYAWADRRVGDYRWFSYQGVRTKPCSGIVDTLLGLLHHLISNLVPLIERLQLEQLFLSGGRDRVEDIPSQQARSLHRLGGPVQLA
jgi:hypothetical protein